MSDMSSFISPAPWDRSKQWGVNMQVCFTCGALSDLVWKMTPWGCRGDGECVCVGGRRLRGSNENNSATTDHHRMWERKACGLKLSGLFWLNAGFLIAVCFKRVFFLTVWVSLVILCVPARAEVCLRWAVGARVSGCRVGFYSIRTVEVPVWSAFYLLFSHLQSCSWIVNMCWTNVWISTMQENVSGCGLILCLDVWIWEVAPICLEFQ